jgi:AAA15 family ATPase/GTPase
MLEKIQIKNFKSILDDTISLGRVNVFIGENGCGKSNILEALMFASLAETYGTVDADLLYNNGIRVCKPSLMLSSFEDSDELDSFEVNLHFSEVEMNYLLQPENKSTVLSKWEVKKDPIKAAVMTLAIASLSDSDFKNFSFEVLEAHLRKKLPSLGIVDPNSFIQQITNDIKQREKNEEIYNDLENVIIYTLNTEALRGIPEFQRSRKGIYGEKLDVIINELSDEEKEELKNYLYTISWVEDFFIDENDELRKQGYKFNYSKSLLYFKDKFMKKDNNVFSSENSNEGILHVLFYLSNIISSKMPRLFAIDNIDASLNPHLCQHVMNQICELTKKHEKQLLITTHNPAILDGLDLYDDDIRLFEVFRTDNGDTRTRRIQLTPSMQKEQYKLSELWTRGFLGAISDKF